MQRMLVLMMGLLAGGCQKDEIANQPDVPAEFEVLDLDGDGYATRYKANGMELPPRGPEDDCNDGDAATYPGASAPDTACTGGYWDGPA